MAETNTTHKMNIIGKCFVVNYPMTRVFIADSLESERLAIHLLLMDMNMEVVGEGADWSTTLA